ncbi:ribosomal protein L7/L12 [Clostridium sulfidigenes]|uniref:ribosomal protein L7/L12 n=1 Tax=Clostridium sulfidigenes TaxID=318464 RepID=UPI003F89C977
MGCVILGIVFSIVSQLQRDIARINASLYRIEKHIGVKNPEVENIDEELRELISQGKKVRAVKRYRIATGLGLKEAKEYIDRLSERL